MSAEGKMSSREHVLVVSSIMKVEYSIQVRFLFPIWANLFQVLYIKRLSLDIKEDKSATQPIVFFLEASSCLFLI